MVGRQTPLLALVVPLILVGMVDGWRGVRADVARGDRRRLDLRGRPVRHLELHLRRADRRDRRALSRRRDGRCSCASGSPREPLLEDDERAGPRGGPPADRRRGGATTRRSRPTWAEATRRSATAHARDVVRAYAPYLIIIGVFSVAPVGAGQGLADREHDPGVRVAGLDVLERRRRGADVADVQVRLARTPGTLLLICGLLTIAGAEDEAADALKAYGETLDQLKFAILTVAAVLGARVRDEPRRARRSRSRSGWRARAGRSRSSLDPRLARRGDHRLGHRLQRAVRRPAGAGRARTPGSTRRCSRRPTARGGVLGKMISPQNLAIGAAAVGHRGQGGRCCSGRSWAGACCSLLVMCVLVYLQSTSVLSWMVV